MRQLHALRIRLPDRCALAEPGVVDARRCLAWLVQAPGSFPEEYRKALGDRLYGCDECQQVCPVNRLADRRHRADRGPSPTSSPASTSSPCWPPPTTS